MHDFPPTSRRALIVGALAGAVARAAPAPAAPEEPVRAIAFDGFPIFDPRSVAVAATARLGERGAMLAAQWSAKLFGYSWLETAAGQYRSFDLLADDALRFTADAMALPLSNEDRAALVGAYARLDIWPDVKPGLERLRNAGVRLAFLSNLGAATLEANMRRNGIAAYFEPPLSTDRVRRFKPAPEAYAMAIDAFGLPRASIGFAAFGGWDAAGAGWFGYRTAWINRLGVTAETVGPAPAIVSRGMDGVLRLAGLG